MGQASLELRRDMFYGMAFEHTLELHHAYHRIYLDEDNAADHIADLKDEPQGKLRVVVQILPIATLNLASKFVDIKRNLFTGVYFETVWAILKDGILYFYPSNYTQSDSYLKKVDCRKIVKVKQTIFEMTSIPMAGVSVTLDSGSVIKLGWTRDQKWPRKLWLRGLKMKYDDTTLYTSRWTPSPKSAREWIGTPRVTPRLTSGADESFEDDYESGFDARHNVNDKNEITTPVAVGREIKQNKEDDVDLVASTKATPERLDEIRQEVKVIYEKYAPEKVTKLDYLLKKFEGREEEFFDFVRDKYTSSWRDEKFSSKEMEARTLISNSTTALKTEAEINLSSEGFVSEKASDQSLTSSVDDNVGSAKLTSTKTYQHDASASVGGTSDVPSIRSQLGE